MSTVTVRLNKEEEKIFNEYAELNGIPLSTLLKQSLQEKIEDEIDMKIIKEYEERSKSGTNEFYDHNDVKKIFGL